VLTYYPLAVVERSSMLCSGNRMRWFSCVVRVVSPMIGKIAGKIAGRPVTKYSSLQSVSLSECMIELGNMLYFF